MLHGEQKLMGHRDYGCIVSRCSRTPFRHRQNFFAFRIHGSDRRQPDCAKSLAMNLLDERTDRYQSVAQYLGPIVFVFPHQA